jgi:hypothetical protein
LQTPGSNAVPWTEVEENFTMALFGCVAIITISAFQVCSAQLCSLLSCSALR